MTKEQLIRKIRLHWASYVASGGFNRPTTRVGKLDQGGLEHWNKFLSYGRKFVVDFPQDVMVLQDVIPKSTIKILTGE